MVETIAAEVERVKAEQEVAAVAAAEAERVKAEEEVAVAAAAQAVSKAAHFSFHPVLVAVRFHRRLAHEIRHRYTLCFSQGWLGCK